MPEHSDPTIQELGPAGGEPVGGNAPAPRSFLRRIFPPGSVAPSIVAGVAVGVLAVIKDVSLATLLFSGELSDHAAEGIGLVLIGAVVVAVVVAALSSLSTAMATPQDTAIAVLAVVAAAIVSGMPDSASPETRFLTVIAACVTTTVLSGLFFLALGVFRLGGLVRFIPYPVVGGFMAGVGWLIVSGAVKVMASTPVTWHALPRLIETGALIRWGPGLGLALVLLALVRRIRHFLVMPAVVLAAIAIFYVALYYHGMDIASAREGGWLLGPFPKGSLWQIAAPRMLAEADWSVVFSQSGQIGAILIVNVLALLLNASSLELAVRRDINLNRELLAAGVANIASGAAGGMVGYQSLSMSTLTHEMGARTRLAGISAGLVALVALLAGSSFLTYLPRPVIGGLLLYMGLDFLYSWVVRSWSRLPRAEYEVVILILLAVGAFGFLFGVGLGLTVALVLFVMTYSRVRVVKQELTVATRQSNVERSRHDTKLLREHGEEVQILCLQGYLFFGTASQVLDAVRRRAADESKPPLRYVMLDFRLVTGLDSSAVFSFDRMRQVAEVQDFFIVLAHLSESMQRQFGKAGLIEASGAEDDPGDARIWAAPDLDFALEWVENGLLSSFGTEHDEDDGSALWRELESIFGDVGRRFLRRRQFEAGEYLMRQGDEAADMLFVLSGQVTVVLEMEKQRTVRLRTMRPGTVVGEIGWYVGMPRSASVVAETRTSVCRLSRTALTSMSKIGPRRVAAFHEFMAKLLADRLSEMTARLGALLE